MKAERAERLSGKTDWVQPKKGRALCLEEDPASLREAWSCQVGCAQETFGGGHRPFKEEDQFSPGRTHKEVNS